MVLSMTGYGRAGALLHGRDIKVELRSVNARFFEYSSRLPRSCAFLEDKLKKLVASKVSRGKVELSLSIQTVTAADTVVTVKPASLATSFKVAILFLLRPFLTRRYLLCSFSLPIYFFLTFPAYHYSTKNIR